MNNTMPPGFDANPLKQYFRKPAVFIRLPSGGHGYPSGSITMPENGELPVFPMTALDEIAVRTPDALYNGTALVEVVKSCIPNIKEPWNIQSMDLDTILIGIKIASNGSKIEIESQCPSCEDIAKYDIDLVGMLGTLTPGNYRSEFNHDDLVFKFKPLTYRQMQEVSTAQFEFQRMFAMINSPDSTLTDAEKMEKSKDALKSITELTMKTLANTIEYIKTPTAFVENQLFIHDFLKNCDRETYTTVRDYHATLKESTDIKPINIKCIHCSHDYKQSFTLNMSDFFE